MADMREREDRKTEERQERRRRRDDTIDGSQRLKLAIPAEVEARLKSEGRTPRWVVKDSARMRQLTQLDDYDPVDGVETVPTRSLADGKPVEMMLLSKPTAFVEEDRKKADKPRKEMEEAFLRGQTPGNPHSIDRTYSEAYVDEATSIRRGGSG